MWKPMSKTFGAGTCVHTLIIMKWGMGLNSGACAELVDINQVP